MKEFYQKRIPALVLTLAILIIGSALYIATDRYSLEKSMAQPLSKEEIDFYRSLELKSAYSPEGFIKVFATGRKLPYRAEEGSSDTSSGMVIGNLEAGMMISEGLIKGPGSTLEDFFGTNVVVAGILPKKDALTDDFHFLSRQTFDKIQGESNLRIRIKDEAEPKLFGEYNSLMKFTLSEGSFEDFRLTEKDNRIYHPVLIGSKEAEMMKKEKLFQQAGDTISDFFGRDIVIAGVLAETNTSLDMMHIVLEGFFQN